MKDLFKVAVLALSVFTSYVANAKFEGQTCPKGTSDPLKCMVCVLYFEAKPTHYDGMVAVGRVVMERVESRNYPDSICKVAYQKGQFVALPTGRKMSKDPKVMALVVKAAKAAIAAKGNGMLGFRTCKASNKKQGIGGNCFRQTGELEGTFMEGIVPEIQTATLLDSDSQSINTVNGIMSSPLHPAPVMSEMSGTML